MDYESYLRRLGLGGGGKVLQVDKEAHRRASNRREIDEYRQANEAGSGGPAALNCASEEPKPNLWLIGGCIIVLVIFLY